MSLLLLLKNTAGGVAATDAYSVVPQQQIVPRKPRQWQLRGPLVNSRWRWAWSRGNHLVLPMWETIGGEVHDYSGAMRNGVAPSATQAPDWTTGRRGPCVQFDEVDDRYDITNFQYEANQSTVTPEFTIAVWLLITSNAGSAFKYVWSQGQLGAADSLNIYAREDSASSPRQMSCQIRLTGAGAADQVNSVAEVADGLWHSYVLTLESNRNVRVYVDGEQTASVLPAAGTGGFNPSDDIRIGANRLAAGATSADRFFGGYMETVNCFRGCWNADAVREWHALSYDLLFPAGGMVVGTRIVGGVKKMMPEQLGYESIEGALSNVG